MLSAVADEAAETARQAVSVCWNQWAALGSHAATAQAPDQTSIVDPEGLVLMSLAVRDSERRLGDLVAWWARSSSRLMSVQRMGTLAGLLPDRVGERCLAEFSVLATGAGDRRWRRFARDGTPGWVRSERLSPEPDLLAPAALWPRLRSGFGVGAKADVLVFLLGVHGAAASVPDIASATHYTKVSVRRAAAEMSAAGLLRETSGRPASYLAPMGPWTQLLEVPNRELPGTLPRWRYWADVFAFLVHVIDWTGRARGATGSEEHVLSSEARDIVNRHTDVLHRAGVQVPLMDQFRGREAPAGLLGTTRAVVSWIPS